MKKYNVTCIQFILFSQLKRDHSHMIDNSIQYGKFKFGIVNNDDVLQDTFRMRYEVYVDEFGFEKKEDHPNGLETDDYENEAIHFACLNENDAVVGTIRLVLNSSKGFPIEHAVETSFVGEKPERSKIAEISRLTVSPDLRRRKEDGMYGVESYLTKKEGGVLPDDGTIPEEMKGRKNPIIVLGLYQVMYHESCRRGITHWYMITEKKIFYALFEVRVSLSSNRKNQFNTMGKESHISALLTRLNNHC